MSKSPDTTILVVAYRQAAWIEQCLDSCLSQTQSVQIIVVDDASHDNTPHVVRDWALRNSKHVDLVAHEDNIGLGASLAEGLARIETDFFAYIAGDDWMEPERIERQAAAFNDAGSGCVLVYSDCYRADEDGNIFEALFSEGLEGGWKPDLHDTFDELINENWIPAPTVMIRTAALRSVGGYDPDIFYEDHDSYLRLSRVGQFRCVPLPLATHREMTSTLGHRMFFYPDTAPLWMRAKILIYRKHLGFRSYKDGEIAQRIAVWTVILYKTGHASGSETAKWLADAIPYLDDRANRFRVFHLLARLRIPGRFLSR